MKKQLIYSAMIIFSILILSACGQQNPPAPDIPMLTQPAQTEAPTNALTLASFNNAQIYCLQSNRTVQLTNGSYEGGTGANYLKAWLLPQAAFADLNGDGREDAAVLLAENMGGSGTFVTLNVMIATDSGFAQAAPQYVNDRPLINSLMIEGNKIVLDAVIHSASDSMADPTMLVVEEYAFGNGILMLSRFDSTISGASRTIVIDLPTDGQDVTGSVEIKGSMPIAPFENTLAYTITDDKDQILTQGAFMVNAADFGAPATFDNMIPLTEIASGSKIRIALREVSMADSSTLCLNSVEVVVK